MTAPTDMRFAATRMLVGLALLGLACGDPQTTEPDAAHPALAKAAGSGGGPTVSAANPSFGEQGTASLDVQIAGSGFDQGSQALWDSAGAPYAKIKVNSTTFVSSSQLTANITIASTAAVQYYDIAVTTSKGRKGVGTELFAVTLATPIPATSAVAVNDAGRVTGLDASGIYVFDVGGAKQDIGFTGTPWGIDESGTTVGGQNSAGAPAVWTFAFGGWSEHPIPDLGLGGAARALASDGAAAAILAGNVNRSCNAGTCHTPAKWVSNGSGGWNLTVLPLPAGSPQAFSQGVNASGMVVGMEGTTCCKAFFWDADGTVTVLPPLVSGAASAAWAINGDGTTIAGESNRVAVAWTRTSTAGAWVTPVTLENTASFCRGRNAASIAYAINNAGTIVGASCGIPVAWKPSGTGYVRVVLGDLGNHPSGGSAVDINNATTPIAVGTVDQAVYWTGF